MDFCTHIYTYLEARGIHIDTIKAANCLQQLELRMLHRVQDEGDGEQSLTMSRDDGTACALRDGARFISQMRPGYEIRQPDDLLSGVL